MSRINFHFGSSLVSLFLKCTVYEVCLNEQYNHVIYILEVIIDYECVRVKLSFFPVCQYLSHGDLKA